MNRVRSSIAVAATAAVAVLAAPAAAQAAAYTVTCHVPATGAALCSSTTYTIPAGQVFAVDITAGGGNQIITFTLKGGSPVTTLGSAKLSAWTPKTPVYRNTTTKSVTAKLYADGSANLQTVANVAITIA